ncbi:MAG: AmmeMemoRadiSam system radical SAM enzyme [Gammaproteobacteria bacterium]|nr:MAG: AmmeMemoRadiSam system radical SAM enzyme [Gammaproteobacteria bacterium]
METNYWHQLTDGRIQCDLCPRACKLHEGQQGLCFVRACENHQIILTTYGRSSGFCIDPIEKKPLHHFYPGTSVLSFGTAGCNLSCKFCQNWDMSKSREMDTLCATGSPTELVDAAKRYDCKSLAYTYNDPVIFLEYARDIAIVAKQQSIKSVAVTAGYISPEPRVEFFKNMDAVNIDLKSFNSDFYHQLCGGDLQTVLDTLLYIHHETSVWLEITTLLIPGKNDSDEEIKALAGWIAKHLGCHIPLHFSAFHPDWKMNDIPATPGHTLSKARQLAMAEGMQFVYTGNVHDAEGGSTWCPDCNALLIERDWYQLGHWGLDENACCSQCGYQLPGHFDERPGNWGAKRLPIRLN